MLTIRKRMRLFFVLVGFVFILFNYSSLNAQEHETIVEEVTVQNIEIPVRVFSGNKTIGGLKKEDFLFTLNGEPVNINGFYEVRKKIDDEVATGESTSPQVQTQQTRLFILIFNLSSFDQDLATQIDTLFKNIIRSGDQLMVISNRYYIPEWKVKELEVSKRLVFNTLEKEVKEIKLELLSFEADLGALASSTVAQLNNSMTADAAENNQKILREFFLNYRFALDGIQKQYLSLPVSQYIKIAEYLKSQPSEKWILNYYQMGRLPMLNKMGEIYKKIDEYLNSKGNLELKQDIYEYYLHFLQNMQMTDNQFINDIGKAFLNSGAVVHTQLLKPIGRFFSYEFNYETVNTESESILKKLSHLTGGSVITSNLTEKFVNKIVNEEDIVYMITYVPSVSKKGNRKGLKIKIKNKGYRVVYDNQKRLKYFKSLMDEVKAGQKAIEISSMTFQNDILLIKLNNIQVVQNEKERFGAVETAIKIVDTQGHLIKEFKKIYKGIKKDGVIQVKLPFLTKGEYNVILEVKDLFSFERVKAGDALSITKI